MLEHFFTQVGFGSVDISHNFDSWECVLRNFESGVAPLRAYRKTIQFRLLFHSIRSPKTPQNSFQPEHHQYSNLTPGWSIRPSGFVSLAQIVTLVIISTLGCVLGCFIRDWPLFLAKLEILSLSSPFFFFFFKNPWQTLENLKPSSLNLKF